MAYRDFRNYLETVDPYALEYTGNDGRIDYDKVQASGADTKIASFAPGQGQQVSDYIQKLYAQYLNPAGTSKLPPLGGGGGGAPRAVYAPKLDIAALNANARSKAEGAVNPYYTKVLNEFLAKQAAQRQQREQQTQTDIQNIGDVFKNITESNQLNRERTTEDVNTNKANINQTADEFQTDSGEQFNEDRLALAKDTTASGLTGGLGAQKQIKALESKNKGELRQEQKFQQQRDEQELFKGRTFEDLLKSDTVASANKEKGVKQAQFDLDSYIKNLGFQEQETRNTIEKDRLEGIANETRNQSKLAFNQYLAGIKDPAQYEAAVRTYGGVI